MPASRQLKHRCPRAPTYREREYFGQLKKKKALKIQDEFLKELTSFEEGISELRGAVVVN